MKKIAVFGCGNMAYALVKGIYGQNKNLEFHTYTPSYVRAKKLAEEVNGMSYQSLLEIPECDYYLLACKPQQLKELSLSLENKISKEKVLISILAGIHSEKIKDLFGCEKIIRVMPNTPCLIREGVSLLYGTEQVSKADLDFIKKQLTSVSKVFLFKEEGKIDEFVAVSGSGPAYLFEMARILIKNIQNLGLSERDSELMVKQMLYGSSKLLLESEDDAETLRNKVTSKNGVTYEALETLKEKDLESLFTLALERAKKRSIELGKE